MNINRILPAVLLPMLLLGGLSLAPLAPLQAQPRAALPGEPLGDVAINVESIEGGLAVAKGVTGPDGFVRFYNIPAGSFRVVAVNTPRALQRAALKLAAARAARPAVLPSDAAPPPPPPERPASSGLAMPTRPANVTILLTAAGTSREARYADAILTDSMEMLQFTVAVSGPVAVSLRHEEE